MQLGGMLRLVIFYREFSRWEVPRIYSFSVCFDPLAQKHGVVPPAWTGTVTGQSQILSLGTDFSFFFNFKPKHLSLFVMSCPVNTIQDRHRKSAAPPGAEGCVRRRTEGTKGLWYPPRARAERGASSQSWDVLERAPALQKKTCPIS